MRFLVAAQLKEPIGSSRSYKIKESFELEGGSYPVQGEVTFLRTNRGILVQGRVCVEMQAICSRCLNPFTYPLPLEIKEEFFPSIHPLYGYALPPPTDPDVFTIDERQFLDLDEALRQNVLSNMPMRFLCHPDCAGLCPQCGANLNDGPCSCQEGR